MAEESSNPFWVVILVGALSGVIGAVIGPVIQRAFGRNDRALNARQVWAKDKLQTVFGIGDPWLSTDGPVEPFTRLVPPHGATPQIYDMHTINWAVQESVDYMLLQPRRSRWARQWIYNWHFVLHRESRILHDWMHDLRGRNIWSDATWEKANSQYVRRVGRVQSSLSIWATGQWLTHPSLRIWISSTDRLFRVRQRSRGPILRAPKDIRLGVGRICDCYDLALLNRLRAEAANGGQPASGPGAA